MTDSLHTFGADASPFISAVDQIIAKLRELEQRAAAVRGAGQLQETAARGRSDLEGELRRQADAAGRADAAFQRQAATVGRLQAAIRGAARSRELLNRLEQNAVRLASERVARTQGLSPSERSERVAAETAQIRQEFAARRVAEEARLGALRQREVQEVSELVRLDRERAAATNALVGGVEGLQSLASRVERDLSNTDLQTTASFAERINQALESGNVEQILDRRRRALEAITQELLQQRTAAEESTLTQAGSRGENLRRDRARAAQEENRAAAQLRATEADVTRILKEQGSILGRNAEQQLAQARRLRQLGSVSRPAELGLPEDASAERVEKVTAALNRRLAAEERLTVAQRAREDVERRFQSLLEQGGTAQVVDEINQRLQESIEAQANLAVGAEVPALAERYVDLQAELEGVATRLSNANIPLKEQEALARRAAEILAELAQVERQLGEAPVRPLTGPELAAGTPERQFTRFQQLAIEAAEGFGRRFRATLQFAISGAAIFAAQRLVREFAQAAIQVQRSFADIESALEFDIPFERGSAAFNQAVESNRRQILALANEFNTLPTEANDAAEQIIGRFTNTEAAMEALRAQLLATKIATIDQSEALRSLSAIGESFATTVVNQNAALTGQERLLDREIAAARLYTQALDNAVVIQLQWGLAVEETVEGTARLGATLSQLGFTLEETQALIAGVALQLDTTATASAERVNRAFGQITSDQTRSALLEIARASDDFNLSLQDFLGPNGGANVFNRISEQIQELEGVDPQVATRIFEAIGGRRELEVVAAAFRSTDIRQAILESFDGAAGAAERRFSFLARTVEELIQSIVTRFQELAQNLERLGLLGPIQIMLETLDRMLSVLNAILQIWVDIKLTLDNIRIPFLDTGLGTALVNLTAILLSIRGIYATVKALQAANIGGALVQLLGGGGVRRAAGTRLAGFLGATGPGALLGRLLLGPVQGPPRPAEFARPTTLLTGGQTGFRAVTTGFARVAGVAGLLATAFFAIKGSVDRSRQALDAFVQETNRLNDLQARREAAGPQPGETGAEFRLRIARQRRDDLLAQTPIGQETFSQTAFDFLVTAVGGAGEEAIKQQAAFLAQQTGIRDANKKFIEAAAEQLRTGLEEFDPRSAGITPETGQNIADAIAELNRLDEIRGAGLSDAEAATLATDYESLVSLYEGIVESFNATLEEFAADTTIIQREASRIGPRLQLGDITGGDAIRAAFQAVQDQIRVSQELAGTPGAEEAQGAVDTLRTQAIQTVQTVFEGQREALALVFDERARLEETIAINRRELLALANQGITTGARVQQLLIETAVLEQQVVDSILQSRAAFAQAALGNARNVDEFEALSFQLARALALQVINLEQQKRFDEAALLEETRKGVLNQAFDRREEERIERLVQQRLLAGRVNDRLAQVQAELIRVEEQLKDSTRDLSERQALLNEQRQLLAQQQEILLDRFRAAVLLEAGTNNTILQLQATITANARELEFLAATEGEQSAAFLRLQLAQKQAQSALADALLELEEINLRLDSDLTNDYVQAQIDLAVAVARANRADLGELEQAQADLAVAQAEIRATQAFFDDRLFFLKFQFETGQIGTAQYLDSLRRLQENVDTTTHQGQEIWLQIESLINGLTNDVNGLQFNIPSAIRLPTLFEIRRSLAADALGVDYQDNRTINVNVDATNIEDFRLLLREIEDAFGTRIDQQSLAIAPGQASFTIGGF